MWLKDHNPHYVDLEIVEENLDAYPEDDVPVELTAIVWHCPAGRVLEQENGGYVIDNVDEVEDTTGEEGASSCFTFLTGWTESEAVVIPLSACTIVDTNLSTLSPADVLSSGMSNMTTAAKETAYGVRHGSRPVRDFPPAKATRHSGVVNESDFFERAFPCLFPWGQGGFYRLRSVKVEFREHVQWALRYADHRFRVHDTFPFVAFGIVQCQQALAAATIRMKTKRFQKDYQMLRTITLDKLRHAQVEEEANKPITNPAVQILKRHVTATLGRVMGSDQTRYQMRSQIWSTTMCKGPPTLWMTINPSDLHDPIAQVLVGEDIHLNQFTSKMGPSAHQRAQNLAKDPYAASEYFHFIVEAIFETLFQIKTTKYKVTLKKGVLGQVEASALHG